MQRLKYDRKLRSTFTPIEWDSSVLKARYITVSSQTQRDTRRAARSCSHAPAHEGSEFQSSLYLQASGHESRRAKGTRKKRYVRVMTWFALKKLDRLCTQHTHTAQHTHTHTQTCTHQHTSEWTCSLMNPPDEVVQDGTTVIPLALHSSENPRWPSLRVQSTYGTDLASVLEGMHIT